MFRPNSNRMRLMFVGVVAAMVLGGGNARADFTFGEPTNLGPTINTSIPLGSPSISSDGLEMYFDRSSTGEYEDWDIWVATRETVDEDWDTAVKLGPPVNSSGREGCPCISSDGLTLYFDSIRAGGFGFDDLYVTTRRSTSESWGEPVNLGSAVNSPFMDQFAEVSNDGLSLYFHSARPGGSAEWTVWVTTRKTKDDPWVEPVDLGLGDAGTPTISPNGLALFFSSIRPGGFGGEDVWLTRRANLSAPWSTPVNLGPKVNTSHNDGWGHLSPRDSSLYISLYGSGVISKIRQIPIIPIVDFNGDGIVDATDMCIVTDHWGEDYSLCDIGPTPLGDGVVDVKDLVVLSEHLFEEVEDSTLIAHWPLDEVQGSTAYDNMANCDGTLRGSPIWQPEGGMVAGALLLDGNDDYVSTDFVLNPANEVFSVIAWIKGGATGQVILSQEGGVNWLMADPTDGALRTDLKSPAGTGRGAPPEGPPLICSTVVTDGDLTNIQRRLWR